MHSLQPSWERLPVMGKAVFSWPLPDRLISLNVRVISLDFNAWLASLGESAPVKTLTELREWNLAHERAGTLKYGQANLDRSDELDLEGVKLTILNAPFPCRIP